jgi:hypothetical protein
VLVPFWAQLAPALPLMCRKRIGMDLAAHPAHQPRGESHELTNARTVTRRVSRIGDAAEALSAEVGVVR